MLTTHALCEHPATKAARARCRKENATTQFTVNAVYVNISHTYESGPRNGALLKNAAHKAWPLAYETAKRAEVVLAVYKGEVVGAWEVDGVFQTPDETYQTRGGSRPRVAFLLGEAAEIRQEYLPGVSNTPVVATWEFVFDY